MTTGGWFGADPIRHINGHLFDDAQVLDLDSDSLDILWRVSGLDWSQIKPSIFGTLFERSLDPTKRSQLGAHYTSEGDILLIVEPVLMAPLRQQWEKVNVQAQKLATSRDAAKTKQTKNKAERKLRDLLLGFGQDLAKILILDAACGSGNFLYVALRQLLNLWKEVSVLAAELNLGYIAPLKDFSPHPSQLFGIEINEYAYQLAQATIWIGYIQWFVENGYAFPPEPILNKLDNIERKDAILGYDEQGNPFEPEWPIADVILGNPPFLGDKKMRAELGDIYVDNLRTLYEGRIPGQSDLVCYWFEKARFMIELGVSKRAGLLATQGIRGGANRVVLNRIKETGDIFWAQSDREWILDGATVHVSMVGFDNGSENEYLLDGKLVRSINPDLSSFTDVTKAKRLLENRGLSFIGTQKGGPFDLEEESARKLLLEGGNPNGRPNSDVIKPWVNGADITGWSKAKWIIDFGSYMSIEDASNYTAPFENVKKYVYPVRKNLRRKNHSKYWWIHAESRPGMRKALSGLHRYICTPRVSKYRIFVWLDKMVVPDSATVAIARSDDYFFGILHSKLHENWARSMGTQLREAESGFRYTPTTTFEKFPFPWPPGQEPENDQRVQEIADAASELVKLRDEWLNPPGIMESEIKKRTLTNLYNLRPTWLELAHKKLDKAVFNAYGWPDDLTDDEILERLLALNFERAKSQQEGFK
jgi:type II restriction/modification system DNA methylase subunit YeeA